MLLLFVPNSRYELYLWQGAFQNFLIKSSYYYFGSTESVSPSEELRSVSSGHNDEDEIDSVDITTEESSGSLEDELPQGLNVAGSFQGITGGEGNIFIGPSDGRYYKLLGEVEGDTDYI